MSTTEIVLGIVLCLNLWALYWLRQFGRTVAGELHRQREGETRILQDAGLRHAALLDAFAAAEAKMEASESRQLARNVEHLHSVLAVVVSDFRQRLTHQFAAHLEALTTHAANSEDLLRRMREEQMESMHHARRVADKMDNATASFASLMAENSEMLALSGQVRETLSFIGSRQDSLDGGIRQQAESVDALSAAMRELRAEFAQAAENLLLQNRRSLDAMAQRQAQGNTVLQKEISDSLTKAISGVGKQLSGMGPLASQAMRASR